MPIRSCPTLNIIILIFSLLLAIPSLAYNVSAGTIWHEGASGFTNGTIANLSFESKTLTLDKNGFLINNWAQRSSDSPSPRKAQAMVYDSAHGVVVLFGGTVDDYNYLNDTWTYNFTTNKWMMMNPSIAPPDRAYHAMAYDSTHDEVVLFGGYDGFWMLNDTWTYNFSRNIWTKRHPSNAPPGRMGHAMNFDIIYQTVVLFGGQYYTNTLFDDIWTYDYTADNWTNMNPSNTPPGRAGHAMAYDNAHGEEVIFGGEKPGRIYLNDTWVYNLTNNKWIKKEPLIAPLARINHAMVFDSTQNITILFGGWDWSHNELSDTWTYDLNTNIWANKTSGNGPIGRDAEGIIYDSVHGGVVLFGGEGTAGVLNDTWIYNYWTYRPTGVYTSSPQDTGGNAFFGTISWDADLPRGTSLSFQFQSADTQANLRKDKFIGPDGTTNSFYTVNGQQISSANNGSRWFQYRAYFHTDDITLTPTLRGVTVNYNLLQSIELLSPTSDDNWTGVQLISWNSSDRDNDSLLFDIYLIDSMSQMTALAFQVTAQSWQWNTSDVETGIYKIRIIAQDDNISIPLSINSTTGEFKVYNNSPNLIPNINIVYPRNGTMVFGIFNITGTAARGESPLEQVEVRIDGSNWKHASGLQSWMLELDTRTLTNGQHTIEARALGGTLYSNIYPITIIVNNTATNMIPPSNHTITIEQFPWIVVFIILAAIGLLIAIYLHLLR